MPKSTVHSSPSLNNNKLLFREGLECAYAQKYGELKSFSEQQLVDCSKSYGNNGCNGGLMDHAFKYAETNKMELESDYTYKARTMTCKYNLNKGVMNTASFTDVMPNSA